MSNFAGVFAALSTPMSEDGSVDYHGLESLIEYLITDGELHGIIPLGSTGEYYALNDEEKREVTRQSIAAVDKRVPVLIGTNSGSTADVIRQSMIAQEAGADGVLLAAPYYSLPSPSELIRHFETVNKALEIPIMLYNYPARTGVDLTPDIIETLSELDRVEYVKESTGDSARVSEIIRRCGNNIKVFCGSDSIALESFLLGCVGWVAGIANVIPHEHVELYRKAVEENDFDGARKLMYRMLPFLSYLEGNGKYTQFVKAGCEIQGRPIGPPRMPLLRADERETAQLSDLLNTLKN